MRFSRRFCLAAACTLSVLLLTSAAQGQHVKLLPNDTEMTVTFNIQQILKSEVITANKAVIELAKGKFNEALDDKGVSKWLKKADFDLFKDLHSVTFAIPNGRPPEEGVILLEGNFNADKIEAAATEANKEAGGDLKVIMLAGIKVFEISPKDDKTMYVGVISKKMMVAGSNKADIIEAVARSKGDKKANFKSATFKSLSETVNSKQSISFVATSNMLVKLAEKAPEGNPQVKQAIDVLKQMDGFSAAVTIEKNIDVQLGVNTKDKETAAKYAGLSDIVIGAAKLQLAGQAKDDEKAAYALEILNTIKVTAQGSNLVIRGEITFATLEKLMKMIPMPN